MTDGSLAGAAPVPEENTSGRGPAAVVPPELDRWNWGAFVLNWIWGLGNRTYIALLCFVPFLNLVMPFVLGARGSRWAWQNDRWDSIEHFKRVQRRWAIAAAALAIFGCVFFGFVLFGLLHMMKSLEPVERAIELIETDPRVAAHLGTPVEIGWFVMGNAQLRGNSSGTVDLSLSASGPRADGTVYLVAEKAIGLWRIEHLVLELDDTGQRIDITPPPE